MFSTKGVKEWQAYLYPANFPVLKDQLNALILELSLEGRLKRFGSSVMLE
jgi:hypothetical protein